MDDRQRRVGENEALFRHANEQTKAVNEGFAPLTEAFSVVCECGRIECLERLDVTPATYEQTRADSRRFLIVPGHEIPETEQVVDRQPGYFVVEKDPGTPAQIAAETDPRD